MEPTIVTALITGAVSLICAIIAAFTASSSTAKKLNETVVILETNILNLEKTITKLEDKLDNAGESATELAKKFERLEVRVETLEREMKEAKQLFT